MLPGLLLWAATVPAFASDLPFYGTPDFSPHWFSAELTGPEDFHRVADFSLTNQDGETITGHSISGKIYVASFFFSTCPGICPAIRSKLARVQEHFADDEAVLILSHSIRPSFDTPEILRAYAVANSVQSEKWHLLTGNKAAIYKLARDSYFANEDLGSEERLDDFLHTENLLLVDQNRHIRGIYNGLSASSVKHLIEDIEVLKAND